MADSPAEILIVEQDTPSEQMARMCLKAEMNYLCFLSDMADLPDIRNDKRVSIASSIKDKTKQILLFKSADENSSTEPVRLKTSDGKAVPLTYGAASHMIIWSEKPGEVGMILTDPSPQHREKNPDRYILQKTPRYLGKPLPIDLPKNMQEFKMKDSIEYYKQFSERNPYNEEGVKDRFEARLHKLRQAIEKRRIETEDKNSDPYQLLYEHLVVEIQQKLQTQGLIQTIN